MNAQEQYPVPKSAASQILEAWRVGGVTVSWLNHYSALVCDWNALRKLDLVGIDGTLLQILLRSKGMDLTRSSADLTLPSLLRELASEGRTVAIVGGAPGVAERASTRLSCRTVFVADGFNELARLRQDAQHLTSVAPDVVLVGLGAPLQDVVASELAGVLPRALIATVGGWIDQLAAADQYFPPLVHRLRLGWLWRILHEPRRLTSRYTVFAVRAVLARERIVSNLRAISTDSSGAFVRIRSLRGDAP